MMHARKTQRVVVVLLTVLISCLVGRGAVRLDRGLVAVPREDGSVFLSWRLLARDTDETRFTLVRREGSGADVVLTASPYRLTNFVDKGAWSADGAARRYELRVHPTGDTAVMETAYATVAQDSLPYLRIPLAGDYDFQKVGVGDLTGDGALEILIKQPNFNTDPYQQPGYWKPSTTTYKIEAYRLDGTMLWRHDMGWSIEAGIWYSPWVVYDVDGDGKAEVYCKAGEGDPRDEKGLVQTGPEWLVKLDGETGRIVAKTDWLSRDGYPSYNYYCRNFLAVAYLDGKTPSIIMQRGTYNLIKTQAMDKDFKTLWYWDSTQEERRYAGQGSHGLITADVTGDGRDELVIGAAVLDGRGKGLWSLEMGHPDICYVADIDPSNPGLEIYYGFESRQKANGMCVVDAKTGRILWGHKEPTFHLHGQGMAADVLAEHPGMEVLAGERDHPKRWLYSATGELIETDGELPLSPRPLWWDDDPQKEVLFGRTIRKWNGPTLGTVEGRVIAVMDCLGDHREEIVTSLRGELRIYTTTIPSQQRRLCLLEDRQYRLGVVAQTMGYYYPAQLGK
jgi:rhamnogalacturonan endolyase